MFFGDHNFSARGEMRERRLQNAIHFQTFGFELKVIASHCQHRTKAKTSRDGEALPCPFGERISDPLTTFDGSQVGSFMNHDYGSLRAQRHYPVLLQLMAQRSVNHLAYDDEQRQGQGHAEWQARLRHQRFEEEKETADMQRKEQSKRHICQRVTYPDEE